MNMADLLHIAPGLNGESLRGQLRSDEPMARHVSWRSGGMAARCYVPADIDDLAAFLRLLPAGEPLCFVGLGSNLLVRDGGFRGTVVLMHNTHAAMRMDGGLVFAGAGAAAPKVARFAARHDLEGAEFLAGIPGTLGGALAMNAGCYGSETWEFVDHVQTIDRHGQLHERTPSDYRIAYRHCELLVGGEECFLGAWLRFRPGDGAASRERIRELLGKRIASQPLNLPNAGSVFRNPPGDYAARLIESCGLKGHAIGGARISEKHANFIVNPAGAGSAADIEALIAHARATVKARCGVDLVPEVRIVGDARQEGAA
jgi:UDP-N-acetylmuramate dehydrogenase